MAEPPRRHLAVAPTRLSACGDAEPALMTAIPPFELMASPQRYYVAGLTFGMNR
jgi:ABC-type maltose transport system permease subunit